MKAIADEKNVYYVAFYLSHILEFDEIDVAFEKCSEYAEQFIDSEYDKDTKSLIECLNDFIKGELI